MRPVIGLEVVDGEGVRVDVAVPAHHVERVVVELVVLVPVAHPHHQVELAAVAVGDQLGGRVEVALREGRVLEQLAVAVAVAVRRLDLAGREEREEQLLVRLRHEAIGGAARDHHVVVLAVGQRAEDGLELTLAAVHEQHLVALAVAVVVVVPDVGTADRDLHVAVPHQQAAAHHRVALRLDPARVDQVVRVRVRHPLHALDRLELAERHHAAGGLEVVEDRLVAGEALEPHHLLGEQGAVVAEGRVALARHAAAALVPHRFPLSSCSRSIASKSALKLPSPKPREPWRSMISKNIVGRSPLGFVKICSR